MRDPRTDGEFLANNLTLVSRAAPRISGEPAHVGWCVALALLSVVFCVFWSFEAFNWGNGGLGLLSLLEV